MQALKNVIKSKKAIGAAIALSAASFGAYKLNEHKTNAELEYKQRIDNNYIRLSEKEVTWRQSLPKHEEFQKLYSRLQELGTSGAQDSIEYKEAESAFLDYLNREFQNHPAINDREVSGIAHLPYTVIPEYIYLNKEDLDNPAIFEFERNLEYYGKGCCDKTFVTNFNLDTISGDNPWYYGEVFRIKTKFELKYLRDKHGNKLNVLECLSLQNKESELAARKATLDSDKKDTIFNTVRFKILSNEEVVQKFHYVLKPYVSPKVEKKTPDYSLIALGVFFGGGALVYLFIRLNPLPTFQPYSPPESSTPKRSGIEGQKDTFNGG